MRLPRSVAGADVKGQVVLVRSDLNVPLEDGRVADDTRLRASLPTLRLLCDRDAAAIRVCSHLGRPKTAEDRTRLAIAPVRERAAEAIGDERVTVLENTRFDPGETSNDPRYARELAEGCDLYVNDAFGSAHRAHASTVGVAELLPAYAGLLLLEELRSLGQLLGDVERPFVLVAGGAKVDDKLAVLEHLGSRADEVLIGGKMAEELRERGPLPGVEVRCRRTSSPLMSSRPTPRRRSSRRTGSRRMARARHRAGDARGLLATDRRREDGLLERSDGRLRVAALRRRYERDRAGGRRLRRVHGRRRRRFRSRRAGVRAGGPDLVDLDRRRCVARVARRRELPGVAVIPEA